MSDAATIYLQHGGKKHPLPLCMQAVCDIEQEVGPLPLLLSQIRAGSWQASDVVSIVHILLPPAAGEDYMALGDGMIRSGFGAYLDAVSAWMQAVLGR